MTLDTNNRKKGALMMISSAFFFSAMQIAIKMTGGTIPLMEQIFARSIISLIISMVIIMKTGGSFFGEKKHQPLLFVRSAFGFLGFICLFYSAANANQADVTTLTKLSPFLITLWAAIFLKEKVKKAYIPALIIAFAGALFVANPTFNSRIFPLFVAFLCAVTSSVSYTLLAYFKNKVDGMTIIMHFSTFCCVVTIPFMLGNFVMPDAKTGFLLFLIGLLGGLGQITLTYSYRMAPAAEISVYNYSGIVFSGIMGFAFLGEVLPWNSLLGCALVIIASIIVYKWGQK